jgi:hypothetical protein
VQGRQQYLLHAGLAHDEAVVQETDDEVEAEEDKKGNQQDGASADAGMAAQEAAIVDRVGPAALPHWVIERTGRAAVPYKAARRPHRERFAAEKRAPVAGGGMQEGAATHRYSRCEVSSAKTGWPWR